MHETFNTYTNKLKTVQIDTKLYKIFGMQMQKILKYIVDMVDEMQIQKILQSTVRPSSLYSLANLDFLDISGQLVDYHTFQNIFLKNILEINVMCLAVFSNKYMINSTFHNIHLNFYVKSKIY